VGACRRLHWSLAEQTGLKLFHDSMVALTANDVGPLVHLFADRFDEVSSAVKHANSVIGAVCGA